MYTGTIISGTVGVINCIVENIDSSKFGKQIITSFTLQKTTQVIDTCK